MAGLDEQPATGVIHQGFADIEKQYQGVKAKMEKQTKVDKGLDNKTDWIPFPVPAPEPREKRVEQRRQKDKTRPAHSSVYEIIPTAELPAEKPPPPLQPFKVSSSTVKVFSALLDRSQSHGSVDWVDFEAAMADLGFSVMPRFGSVYTFFPPESMGVKKSLTIHRPHKSRIEGYFVLVLGRRLKRVYGWEEKMFEVA